MKKLNYYLWKLKFFKGAKISNNEVDINNMSEDIIYSRLAGSYIRIETFDHFDADLDRFLKVKNAYNINIIRICAVVFTVFFVISMFL